MTTGWGRGPEDVIGALRRTEWTNRANLRARLSGQRPFPISIDLRPPTGPQAGKDLRRYREWVHAWHDVQLGKRVVWGEQPLKGFGSQRLPLRMVIEDIDDLACCLGADAARDVKQWSDIALELVSRNPALAGSALAIAPDLSHLPMAALRHLAALLPELKQGMGEGQQYLRSLAVNSVGTKFIETHGTEIAGLLKAMHPEASLGTVAELHRWLGVRPAPDGWVTVRPLCRDMRRQLCGLPEMRVDPRNLGALQASPKWVFMIENHISALQMPDVDSAIAIAGAGLNLGWLSQGLFQNAKWAYWGDIDAHGFSMLSAARGHIPGLISMLMDAETLQQVEIRSAGPMSETGLNYEHLSADESMALQACRAAPQDQNRLEQEVIPSRLVAAAVTRLTGSPA